MMQSSQLESLLSKVLKQIPKYHTMEQWQQGIDIDDLSHYRSIDQYVMTQVMVYPELHPLMRKIINAVIKQNASCDVIWDGDEEHLGRNAALSLALLSKKDQPVYFNQ